MHGIFFSSYSLCFSFTQSPYVHFSSIWECVLLRSLLTDTKWRFHLLRWHQRQRKEAFMRMMSDDDAILTKVRCYCFLLCLSVLSLSCSVHFMHILTLSCTLYHLYYCFLFVVCVSGTKLYRFIPISISLSMSRVNFQCVC